MLHFNYYADNDYAGFFINLYKVLTQITHFILVDLKCLMFNKTLKTFD